MSRGPPVTPFSLRKLFLFQLPYPPWSTQESPRYQKPLLPVKKNSVFRLFFSLGSPPVINFCGPSIARPVGEPRDTGLETEFLHHLLHRIGSETL